MSVWSTPADTIFQVQRTKNNSTTSSPPSTAHHKPGLLRVYSENLLLVPDNLWGHWSAGQGYQPGLGSTKMMKHGRARQEGSKEAEREREEGYMISSSGRSGVLPCYRSPHPAERTTCHCAMPILILKHS